MAINVPQGFGHGYGQAMQTSMQQQNQGMSSLMSLIKSPEDKYNDSINTELSASMAPIETAYSTPFRDWAGKGASGIDFNLIDSSGKAYLDWKTQLTEDGGRGLKYAKKNNLLNPIAFKKAYDEQITQMVPEIAQQMITHQQMTGASDDKMRELIGTTKGLKELLIRTGYGAEMFGEQANPIYPWLTEGKGFFGKAWDTVWDYPIPSAIAGYAAYKYGGKYLPGAYKYLKGKMPKGWGGGGGGAGQGAKISKSQAKTVLQQTGGKTKLLKNLTPSLGRAGAVRLVGNLVKGNLPMLMMWAIYKIATQDKGRYKQAQKANLNQVLEASKVNITGIRR